MVYAYYRVSTQTQVENNGTQMQEDVVSKYAEEKGIEIAATFTDKGISGTRFDRPGLMELLANLEKGDRILVQNTSRLWRNDTVKGILQFELKKKDIDVISVEQPTYSIYSKDPNDILINGIMELLDQYERASISLKLYKGRIAKSSKGGKSCGVAPYGYKWDNAEIVIDYNNNLVVGDIFDVYLREKSLSKLESWCDRAGYRTNRGCKFTKKALANILHNDFYIGYVTYAGVKMKGNHEAIIDEGIFYTAQEILER